MSTNAKLITGLIAVAAVVWLGWMFLSKPGQLYQTPTTQTQPMTTQVSAKEFTVVGTPFKFDPAEIRVKQGDKLRITFKNEMGMHNLTIKDLNVATKTIQKGEQDMVEFTADKTGTFEYFCSVDAHKDKGMVGSLVVE